MVSTAPDVRSAVLAAATRLFAARGFEGTSVQHVADEVGVTKQAVLHHFATKEQLRQAVLDAMLSHWKEALPQLLLAATAGEDRFDAVMGELRRFFDADPDRARLVLREALDRPEEIRRVLTTAVRPWLVAIADYIRSGQEKGQHFADVDPEVYVLHVLQLVISAAASADVTGIALLESLDQGRPSRRQGQPEDSRARYDKELVRIARASLFPPALQSTKNGRGKKR
jgi:AcrR family transcriptional regulator